MPKDKKEGFDPRELKRRERSCRRGVKYLDLKINDPRSLRLSRLVGLVRDAAGVVQFGGNLNAACDVLVSAGKALDIFIELTEAFPDSMPERKPG